jgi:uncharacterized protein YxjI
MTDAVTAVPTPSGESTLADSAGAADRLFRRDRFLLHQKHFSLTEKYAVFDEAGHQIAFVKREAHHLRQIGALLAAIVAGLLVGGLMIAATMVLVDERQETLILVLVLTSAVLGIASMVVVGIWLMPKRHINFFTDEQMRHQVLKVFQDQKVAFINATYTIADADLNLLGWCRKNYLYNLIRKRWYVYDAEGRDVCVVLEDSVWRSIVRRVARDVLPLMRTNFIILTPDQESKLGEFNRRFTLLDKYVLDLTHDREGRLDRRLAIAIGVLLDTGERR